jgi:hypothetical protein
MVFQQCTGPAARIGAILESVEKYHELARTISLELEREYLRADRILGGLEAQPDKNCPARAEAMAGVEQFLQALDLLSSALEGEFHPADSTQCRVYTAEGDRLLGLAESTAELLSEECAYSL